MTIVNVRPAKMSYPAVHVSDEDWPEVVRSWLSQYGANEEQAEEIIAKIKADTEKIPAKPWLVATPEGMAAVPPASFLTDFEEISSTSTLDEIFSERLRQIEKEYDAAHDDAHGLEHLLNVATSYTNTVYTGLEAGVIEENADYTRAQLVKAAATLHAAIEYMDRAKARIAALGEPTS